MSDFCNIKLRKLFNHIIIDLFLIIRFCTKPYLLISDLPSDNFKENISLGTLNNGKEKIRPTNIDNNKENIKLVDINK